MNPQSLEQCVLPESKEGSKATCKPRGSRSQEVRTPSAREGVTIRAWEQTVTVDVASPTHSHLRAAGNVLNISLDIFAEGQQSRSLNGRLVGDGEEASACPSF